MVHFSNSTALKSVVLIVALAMLQTASFSQQSVARQWSETQLSCIRKYFAKPTVHARHLAHVSIAMYDAWSIYDDQSQPYFLGQTWGAFNCPYNGIPMPLDGNLLAAQEKAISYAAYRTLWNRYTIFAPGANLLTIQGYLNDRMASLGYDTGITSTDYSDGDPAKLGNYIAAKLQEFALQDGSQQQLNYANTQYVPINGQLQPAFPGNPQVVDPNRWQTLVLNECIDQNGIPIECLPGSGVPALSHEWGKVIPFALTADQADTLERDNLDWKVYLDPGPPPMLDTLVQTGINESMFKWGYVMNIIWHSFHNNDDGVMIDTSPNAVGGLNITNEAQLPSTFSEYQSFYNLYEGGVDDPGYTINPTTGAPYAEQLVPRKDFTRVLSQYWADGPNSETPPGHWFKLFNEVADHPELEKRWMGQGETLTNLAWDVRGYLALGGGIHDAAIACWGTKGYYDSTRPIMAIRWMGSKGQSTDANLPHYHPGGLPLIPGYIELVIAGDSLAGDNNEHVDKIKIYSWRGPFAATGMDGAGWLLAENWWTYQTANFVTPPFAGYYSGHSIYSRTGAEIMTLITGDAYFPGGMGEFTAAQDDYLMADDGPSTPVKLQWATYRDAADQCSLSRIYGGLHPPQDDIPGRKVGLVVGPQAFNHANEFIQANPAQVALSYSSLYVSDQQVGNSWYAEVLFDKVMDTLIVPQLTFLNTNASNTLSFSNGLWINAQVYRAFYTVVDNNVTLSNLSISVQQAVDNEGIMIVPSVGAPFTIDTQNPMGTATVLGAQTVLNELSALTSAEVDVIIEFSEPMNTTVNPQITLVEIAENGGLSLSAASTWTSSLTYRAVFVVTDTDTEFMAADLEISGALDEAGNAQLITMLNDAISIDTRSPQAVVAPSIELITDANSGETFVITVTCDSPMNLGSVPILSFAGLNAQESFTLVNGEWLSDSVYQFTYTLLDGNLETIADIIVAGAQDSNGNILNTTNNSDSIIIDTQNPLLANVQPSNSTVSDNSVASGFTFDLIFSEQMDTLLVPQLQFTADNPLINTLVANNGTSAWLDATTYRVGYSVIDSEEELTSITLEITGTADANGNVQLAPFTSVNPFTVDTRNPLVLAMSPSTTTISSNDIGSGMFTIEIVFDEAMDETVSPAIAFTSTPSVNFITNPLTEWTSNSAFNAVYDVPNETLQTNTVSIALAGGARDMAGNAAVLFAVTDAFSIDVLMNSVVENTSMQTAVIYPNPSNGAHQIVFRLPDTQDVMRVSMFNSIGEHIEDFICNDLLNVIDVANQPSGAYYLRAFSSTQEISLPFVLTH